MEKESAFSSRLLTRPVERIQSTCCILWIKNYRLALSPDQRQITEVKNAHRLKTHFRSPQLDLWQLSDTEWLLALRRPEPVARKKQNKVVALAEQLTLPEFGATG